MGASTPREGTESGARAAVGDLKSMRARLEAAKKESARVDGGSVSVSANAAAAAVVVEPVMTMDVAVTSAPVVGAPVVAGGSKSNVVCGVVSLYRDYY